MKKQTFLIGMVLFFVFSKSNGSCFINGLAALGRTTYGGVVSVATPRLPGISPSVASKIMASLVTMRSATLNFVAHISPNFLSSAALTTATGTTSAAVARAAANGVTPVAPSAVLHATFAGMRSATLNSAAHISPNFLSSAALTTITGTTSAAVARAAANGVAPVAPSAVLHATFAGMRSATLNSVAYISPNFLSRASLATAMGTTATAVTSAAARLGTATATVSKKIGERIAVGAAACCATFFGGDAVYNKYFVKTTPTSPAALWLSFAGEGLIATYAKNHPFIFIGSSAATVAGIGYMALYEKDIIKKSATLAYEYVKANPWQVMTYAAFCATPWYVPLIYSAGSSMWRSSLK